MNTSMWRQSVTMIMDLATVGKTVADVEVAVGAVKAVDSVKAGTTVLDPTVLVNVDIQQNGNTRKTSGHVATEGQAPLQDVLVAT